MSSIRKAKKSLPNESSFDQIESSTSKFENNEASNAIEVLNNQYDDDDEVHESSSSSRWLIPKSEPVEVPIYSSFVNSYSNGMEIESPELSEELGGEDSSSFATNNERITGVADLVHQTLLCGGFSGSGKKCGAPKERRHPVWNEFTFVTEVNALCNYCQKELRNVCTTNVKKHLQANHTLVYERVLENEKIYKDEMQKLKSGNAPTTGGGQKSHHNRSAADEDKEDKYLRKQKLADEALCTLLVSPGCPLDFVESEFFRNFLHSLDARYSVPCLKKLINLMETRFENVKNAILEKILKVERVSFSLNVWRRRRSRRSPYLAVTTHFYCHTSCRLENALLAVRPISGDVYALFESVCREWRIPTAKIFRIVTDNGGEIICEFRDEMLDMIEQLDVEPENLHKFYDTLNSNSEIKSDDRVEEFSSATFQNRLHSIADELRRILHTVLDEKLCSYRSVRAMLVVIEKFQRSQVMVVEDLVKKSGKVLLFPTNVKCWAVIYMVLNRFLEIRFAVSEICIKHQWPPLGDDTLNELEILRDLLKPFFEETRFDQAEKYVSLSTVYPTLKFLLSTLDHIVQKGLEKYPGTLSFLYQAKINFLLKMLQNSQN